MARLILVPTPIGNLSDITYRAIEVLTASDLILAEDTRKTGILLKHYGIETKMLSHHKFNEHKFLQQIIERLLAGETLALVTDAGTPVVSDPGFLLVRECIRNGIAVECLPGATALIPAWAVSGIPGEHFMFVGFLPLKKGRQSKLQWLAGLPSTLILYESPHRVIKTLKDLSATLGPDRQVSVSREISKLHEETIRGKFHELLDHFERNPPRGEFVLVIAPPPTA